MNRILNREKNFFETLQLGLYSANSPDRHERNSCSYVQLPYGSSNVLLTLIRSILQSHSPARYHAFSSRIGVHSVARIWAIGERR